jgi:intracellular sulfur oxidation DsrE/DsrF family protein
MGSPDEKLGHILLGNFLRILGDREDLPKYIVLWNSGVKNAISNSDILEYLKTLQNRGVEIISCRTCVEYYDLDDDMAAGIVDGMARIVDILATHQVLTI